MLILQEMEHFALRNNSGLLKEVMDFQTYYGVNLERHIVIQAQNVKLGLTLKNVLALTDK